MSELSIQGRLGRLKICSDVAGRPIESALDLSFVEAGAILASLAMRSHPAQCPDPAKCARGPAAHPWSTDCEMDEGWGDLKEQEATR